MPVNMEEELESVPACAHGKDDKKQMKTTWPIQYDGLQTGNNASTNIILLFSLALDGTYTVLKISFATRLYALGKETGPDIFYFVVFLMFKLDF